MSEEQEKIKEEELEKEILAIIDDLRQEERKKAKALEDLLSAVEQAKEYYNVECYITERSRHEMVVQLGYLALGFILLGLTVVLPAWYWRLVLVVGNLLLSWAWSLATRAGRRWR